LRKLGFEHGGLEGGIMAENGTNVTRRTLLQWSGGMAAFFAAAGVCVGQRAPWNALHPELSGLTAESFLPLEGQTLVFSRPVPRGSILSQTVELKLVKVDRHERVTRVEAQDAGRYSKRARAPFSLVLELSGSEPLGDGLHRLVHSEFAGHQLFLSQVGQPRPDGGLLYEAVFG
jgi:hypothetical protein